MRNQLPLSRLTLILSLICFQYREKIFHDLSKGFQRMTEESGDMAAGVGEIDRQHRELVNTANNLFNAVQQGKSPEEIKRILEALESFMIEHFSLEEKYMEGSEYPDAGPHRERHEDFAKEFLKLKEEFRRKEDSSYITLMFGGWLYKWLNEHFASEDRALVKFLKDKT
jgi:hemerythrin